MFVLTVLLMVLSLLYSRSEPSIPEIRVTYHGFPVEWLKIITHVFPEAPSNVEILPLGFAVDFASYLLISCIIAFIATRTKH